ncbi:serine/threonine-protein kinase [Saccharomonospora viridis]|uniref:serine/threonine-protein kinase n=1 Tax=Saccharomonospora viridis TaxID=1852 RepID=UPI001E2AA113|nr:serine/threonine-protein kinase [Saccharomonospora viridis]
MGDYTLLGRLGSGAMGTVYLGRSRGGRRVAVKLVSAGLAEESSFRDRFRHEVANMRRVGGFWTAGVVDADPDAPRPWVATEYIEGPTLAEYVQDKGPLSEDEVFALGAALAEALVSVHEVGVVHRDLKPGNILISGDGPRVIDFGISRVLDQTTLTATGVAIGTPGFMSPEQVEAGNVGPASDVFSLAGVLVYAATGSGPFDAESLPSVLYAVVHGQPRLDDVPARLRAVLEPCFAKDPTQRPTATRLLESLTPGHAPATVVTTTPSVDVNRPARHPSATLTAVALTDGGTDPPRHADQANPSCSPARPTARKRGQATAHRVRSRCRRRGLDRLHRCRQPLQPGHRGAGTAGHLGPHRSHPAGPDGPDRAPAPVPHRADPVLGGRSRSGFWRRPSSRSAGCRSTISCRPQTPCSCSSDTRWRRWRYSPSPTSPSRGTPPGAGWAGCHSSRSR